MIPTLSILDYGKIRRYYFERYTMSFAKLIVEFNNYIKLSIKLHCK